jgi:hypothetical protein
MRGAEQNASQTHTLVLAVRAPPRKRHSEAVLASDRIDQAAWSESAAASAATFQGRSSSMRLMGCSAMRDRTFRR